MFGFYRMGHPGTPGSPGFPPLKEFDNIRELIFMTTIAESVDGITGYELKSFFSIPQTSVYRVLNALEEKEFIAAEEKIVEGRAQKRYKLTEKGAAQLDELKRSIGSKLSFLLEITTDTRQEGKAHSFVESRITMFKNRVNAIESKEDALFYVDKSTEIMNRQHEMLEAALERSGKIVDIIARLRKLIEDMEEYNPEPILEFIDKEIESFGKSEE